MTVQTAETKTHYAGNGLTTEWPIPFPVVREEHIKLIKTSPDGEDEEITTGYTVNGMESGAVSITYPTTGDPLEAGWFLTIYRDMPLTQTLDLESGGAFDAEVIERQGFDHLVMQIQQVQEQASRALLVAITDVDRDPNKIIDEIFVARTQAASAAGNAEQSAYDSATSAQETQNLLDSVGVGTATHSGFTPLAPEGWEAGHGLILNEDGTTSYGPLLVDVPLASAPSVDHPDGVAGIVIPDGKSIVLNNADQISVASHISGVASFQGFVISNGAISPTAADVFVDTEGAAAADDLTDINVSAAQNGMILRLWAVSAARVITVKHSATLLLSGGVDKELSPHGYLELKRNGSFWRETPRKDVIEFLAAYAANNTYSTPEVDTGKKWTNGKTVYRKIVETGALPNNATKNVAHGITGITALVKLDGIAYRPSTTTYISMLYGGTTISVLLNMTNVVLISSTDSSTYTSSFVMLEYTK